MTENTTAVLKILLNLPRLSTTAMKSNAIPNCTNQATNESSSQHIHTNCTSSITVNRTIDIALAIPLTAIDMYLVLITCTYCLRRSQKYLKWTNRICAVSAFVLLGHVAWNLMEIFTVNITDAFCKTYTVINFFLSIGSRIFVYTVFWIRQRYFYKTYRVLKLTMGKINCVSYSLLAGIIILPLLQIGVLAVFPTYASEIGCRSGPEKPSKLFLILLPVVSVIVSLFQVRAICFNCFLK